jgi:SAM-dependent methyltransferase
LPFDDNEFDEVHAYSVLEHCGTQGDFRFFFAQFEDFWRILKPNGLFIGIVPAWNGEWAWADPGHRRVITRESLIFLDQREYKQVGKTAMCDYRWCYKGDFRSIDMQFSSDGMNFMFVLQAKKE